MHGLEFVFSQSDQQGQKSSDCVNTPCVKWKKELEYWVSTHPKLIHSLTSLSNNGMPLCSFK